ncbi:hypothetical protein GCM10009737_17080 [Nocardioides lentus]|uniref:DUF3618 domain-containing protein n=1 Tax=Nocardioides lentus TaxID=338077 RepID=A0ABP5ANI0_9ACTN
MSGDQNQPQPTPEQLEAELAEQRRRLGETVDALSHKLDVKGQARERVTDARSQVVDLATDDDGRPSVAVAAAAGLAAAALVGWVLLAWSRRSA